MIIRTLTLTLLLAPITAQAEPQPAVQELMHYMDGVAICFETAENAKQAQSCIGQGSSVCMDTEDSGYSTIGMMFCTHAETEAWDILLNIEYASAMAGMRRLDTREAVNFPEFAVRAERLRDAQRAWIPLRDAQCSLEYAMWGAGSMRQTAGASCKLHETADRTIFLRFLGGEMR